MEKRALGRGLSALISSGRSVEEVLKKEVPLASPSSEEAEVGKDKGVVFVELAKLTANKFQPRIHFDEEQLKELVASIKEKGVLAPILVRRQKDQRDKYEIIAGERRFRAACQLKLERVPIVIRDVNDAEALVLSIVENIQRSELNPIEEAHAFARLAKEFSLTQEEISKAVSKDRSTVSNILRLLSLPLEVQKAISAGKLSFGHGKVLLGLDSVPMQIKLTQLVLSKSLSVRWLENHVLNNPTISLKRKKASKEKDPYVADLENQLQRVFGTKVRIFIFKKRGRIQIEFYSNEDRDRVLKILTKKQ